MSLKSVSPQVKDKYQNSTTSSPIREDVPDTIFTDLENDPNLESCDGLDMARLGKKQELTRNFGFVSTLAFSTVFSVTWEYVLLSTGNALVNGGFSGAIYEYIWVFCGYLTVIVSLAEMASMSPTAGGQYHVRSLMSYLHHVLGTDTSC